MNPEKLLNQAATAIANRPLGAHTQYQVCLFKGEIRCLPTRHVPRPEIIFGVFSEHELRDGLTNQQWDRLSGKITLFYWRRERRKITDEIS